MSPALAGGFLTTAPLGKPLHILLLKLYGCFKEIICSCCGEGTSSRNKKFYRQIIKLHKIYEISTTLNEAVEIDKNRPFCQKDDCLVGERNKLINAIKFIYGQSGKKENE